ncbi:transcriptional regulator, PadR-like family [Xylanimonas cellulosilytica DSM 15894]|uniref:Transcriptional regulator, PadR-like family n=1 Tax=Xylanimonas cellulosilytica (strain DSM 15894 / JCM 12276 / CECT 5975 / KCTC 9989 / LMG 20990 / NBRC 107835 / XIL07) TaxID=446471 RepID=D1BXD0_XYLCX|nr:PadR family transcriptional regulator [Xylanimonas cellulosilytica]ACZ29740.1 transcriptional regulator, PadR-like family [Xylanimonas cellulosilytica DSM 15894]
MSIRQGFLALLSEQPMGGYQLRQEFEARTGGTWPLNIGQAYTTLQRLQRDGLVEPMPDDDGAAEVQASSSKSGPNPERYRLTDAGRAEATAWWQRPVTRNAPARDELAIKLALAVTVRGVDVGVVVQKQRTETLRALRDYTRLKKDATADGPGLAWALVLDSLIFAAEAEVRWLDHVETSVLRAAHTQLPVVEPVETTTPPTTGPPVVEPVETTPRTSQPQVVSTGSTTGARSTTDEKKAGR